MRPVSSRLRGLHNLVEAHDDSHQQTADEQPGLRSQPAVEQISESSEDDDAADEGVTCPRRASRARYIVLQGLGLARASENLRFCLAMMVPPARSPRGARQITLP